MVCRIKLRCGDVCADMSVWRSAALTFIWQVFSARAWWVIRRIVHWKAIYGDRLQQSIPGKVKEHSFFSVWENDSWYSSVSGDLQTRLGCCSFYLPHLVLRWTVVGVNVWLKFRFLSSVISISSISSLNRQYLMKLYHLASFVCLNRTPLYTHYLSNFHRLIRKASGNRSFELLIYVRRE